jgi:hypothetical protein
MSSDITNPTINTPTTNRPAQQDYILLDSSGSMAPKRGDSLAAIDNFVAQLRSDNINSTITCATFTTTYTAGVSYQVVRQQTPNEWADMQYDAEVAREGGSTPLYDAINVMCNQLRETMPVKCSILIITDGEENASKTTAVQAKALLDWCRALGWQVTFLGCDFENSEQAKLLGANDTNAIGVSVKRLTDATSLLAEKRARYSQYGTDMDLTSDEKTELGGLLPDHSAK